MESLGIFEYVYLGLFLILIAATIFYGIQTKKLVRDNPKPLIYAQDPEDDEWEKDISNVEDSKQPSSNYLRVKTLLINPGIVPMVLESFSETLIDDSNNVVNTKGMLIQPKIQSSERYGLYVFALPWVTIHDDFSIFYRIWELKDEKSKEYTLKLTFNFKIGNKQKQVTSKLIIKPHKAEIKI